MSLSKNLLKNANKRSGIVAAILFILVFAGCCGISWICTCGVIKLITMCFGWTFSWSMATGIWLITCLARTVFNNAVVKK